MKSRTITLVIVLLVFASVTLATPTESTEYQDSDFLDEFGGYTTEAWNYVAPAWEPITDILYTTATRPQTPFNNDHEIHPQAPNLPFQTDQDILFNGQAIALQPQEVPHAASWYSSSPMMHQQPYVYSQPVQVPINDTGVQELTMGGMEQLELPPMGLSDITVQTCLENASVPRQGVQTVPALPSSWHELPQTPDDQLYFSGQPPAYAIQPLSHNQVAIGQPMQPQDVWPSAPSHLRYGDDGYQHTSYMCEDLQHNPWDNAPVDSRPQPLTHRDQQWPSASEIETPFATRNLRRPHYCSVPSCLYATKGFGRRDHLLRHMRTKHAAH